MVLLTYLLVIIQNLLVGEKMLQTQKKYINFIEDVKKELAVIDTLSNEDFGLENVKKRDSRHADYHTCNRCF